MNRVRVNGELLQLARQREGLTQTMLAELSGVGSPLISRVESGLVTHLPEESARKLADATHVSVRFFDKDPTVRHLGFHRLYRLQRKVGVRALERLESEINARRLHIISLLKKFDVEHAMPLPSRSDFEGLSPMQAAQEIRRMWLVKRGVIGPITPLLEAAGILVVEVDVAEKAFEGLAVHAFDGIPLVFVRKGQTADRRRYTLAHELAHLLLHQSTTEEQEKEAEEFAAELIMPEEYARNLLANFTIQKALELKARYQISVQFCIMRAAQLELIGKDEKTRLFKYVSMKGWRTEEPYAMPPERPTILSDILRSVIKQLAYTVEELADEFGETPDRVRDYFFTEDQPNRLRLV